MGGTIRGTISVVDVGGEQEKTRPIGFFVIETIGIPLINKIFPYGCVLVWDERLLSMT